MDKRQDIPGRVRVGRSSRIPPEAFAQKLGIASNDIPGRVRVCKSSRIPPAAVSPAARASMERYTRTSPRV